MNVAERFLVRSDSDERVQLSEKAFETLCILVRNGGHLVQKNELLNQVWPDSFVEENNLNKCIHAVRRALGEKPGEQQFIETVKKHGFRFVAEVRHVVLEETADAVYQENGFQSKTKRSSSTEFPRLPQQTETQRSGSVVALADWGREANGNELVELVLPSTTPEELTEQITRLESVPAKPNSESKHVPKYRLPLVAFALAAFLIGASAFGGYYFYGNKKASSADGNKTIAVLPLKPINTTNRDDLYEIGIADSLIHQLSSMKGIIIRPLSATRQYTDIAQDPLAAGREQQVDYVLASNYQLADGKIRITAQLLNVASGQIEEAYKNEKDAGDVFAMQDAIAGEVGNILQGRFAVTSSSPTAKRGTTNEEAYRLYLQGMYLSNNRNAADARKAVEALERAVRLDPNYAQAWAGKAYAHRAVGNYRRIANTHEEYQKSIEAINKALALNENLSEAYSVLCDNKMYYEYDFDGAERACKRAIELDPNSPLAHQVYSRYLPGRGRFDEAIAEIKTATDLEPASVFHQLMYGNILHYARRYPEAAAQYKRVLAMDENNVNAYLWLINTLTFQGNESEAFEWFMKSLASQKADEETVRTFQTAFQTSGWQG
ncbi:MAG: winged helix-turn-helix domain-containing protein, partial [Acidobacteriota bacterium]|nr:winged helix-turn-helix domain-containing protein [Acidobacteriota bacterium]